ncbi:MAG: cytochrome c biogenesis heme-transporting ATPase CcmA [Gammaproteobacteria bacterium]|nr:cytochrome c biogenesis heme-transporting ATPase CcmA [Gammaproteobacteria bacterium]
MGSLTAPATQSPSFSVSGLSFTRNDELLFSDLEFHLAPGEVLLVEGQNGSGKTTLLRTLCGLAMPSDGEIRWCGRDIREVRPEFFADLAYVGHCAGLKGELTPVENLAFTQATQQARHDVAPTDALARLGLPENCEWVPSRCLSAGQQRRVALARLLVTQARLWVLDEPFTALDLAGRRQIETMLAEHAAAGGIAILTTHHVLEVDGACTRQLRLGP